MIRKDAILRIERVPLACLQIKGEYAEPASLERVAFYYQKLLDNPGMYAGLLYIVPSDTHPGMHTVLDGRHRYLASILAGRHDVLCVIEDDPVREEKGEK